MTTAEETQHRFNAAIESLGNQQKGKGWHMVLDWKLPGSQYGLSIYGQDWSEVEGYAVNQSHDWTINRGTLKQGKDAKYASSFFWDWDKEGTSSPPAHSNGNRATGADWDDMGDPRAQEPTNGSVSPNKGIVVEGVVQGHLEKLAVDLYLGIHAQIGEAPNYSLIREIRDGLYHQVKQQPIQPEHYCYEDEAPRQPTKAGTWVHPFGDGLFCSETRGLLDAQGNPVQGDE